MPAAPDRFPTARTPPGVSLVLSTLTLSLWAGWRSIFSLR